MTKALYDRLDDDDLRALEAAFDDQTAAYWANADPVVRPYLALHFSAYHGVTRILDKTGMSASMPPDDIHAMARGPVAAGGDPWIADLVVEVVERAGGSLGPGMRGLDFGCSSGRVVRILAAALPEVAWSGCDPNAGAIGWASEALPGIDFFVSPQEPPLELPDGELDMIYAISIWSHFGADAGLRWLYEMRRLLRPGGLLVVTTHGLSSLGKQIESGAMVRDTALACSEALYRSGFWYADVFGEEGDHGVVSQEWGMAYMTPEWLLSRLLPSWRALLYEPARLDANQDVYVLERR